MALPLGGMGGLDLSTFQKYGQLDMCKYKENISSWEVAVFFEMVRSDHHKVQMGIKLSEATESKSGRLRIFPYLAVSNSVCLTNVAPQYTSPICFTQAMPVTVLFSNLILLISASLT